MVQLLVFLRGANIDPISVRGVARDRIVNVQQKGEKLSFKGKEAAWGDMA
jgi:hypothetical protein